MLQIEADIINQIYTHHQTKHLQKQSIKIHQESKIYYDFSHCSLPFPKIFQYAVEETFSYLVMQRLYGTLQQKIRCLKQQSPLNEAIIIQIMYSTLHAIQLVHKLGYLHRDIKPNNFMIRKNKGNKQSLVLMDFGLAKRYLKSNGEHINFKEGKKLTGTPIYCSKNTHQGYQQSRRDDLECWIYTMLHLIKPLPWQTTQIFALKDKQIQNSRIKALKQKTTIKQILKNADRQQYPQCLKQICQYIQNLQFTSQPDYEYLFKVIINYGKKIGVNIDGHIIEWGIKFQKGAKFSPQKNKNLKIKFTLKNKNNRQLNKVSVQQLDKKNLFEQIVYQNRVNQNFD